MRSGPRQESGTLASFRQTCFRLGLPDWLHILPANAFALPIEDEVKLALASGTALMLAACHRNLEYSCINAPFIPWAGLGDSAPSPENPSSKTSRDSGQAVLLHPLGSLVFRLPCSKCPRDRPHCTTWSGKLCFRFLHRTMPTVSPGLAPPLRSQLSNPVTSSQAPCWPWILLMAEPQKKGASVYTLTRASAESDTESSFQVEKNK